MEKRGLKRYLRNAGEKRGIETEAEPTDSRDPSTGPEEANEGTDGGLQRMSQPKVVEEDLAPYEPRYLMPALRSKTPSPMHSMQNGTSKKNNFKKRSRLDDNDDNEYTGRFRAKRVLNKGGPWLLDFNLP